MHGGYIIVQVDGVAAMAAVRLARSRVVTASIMRMDYKAPVLPHEILVLKACVNMVAKTSMEVGVRLEVERMNGEILHAGTAYLTFVALGEDGKPRLLPKLIPENDDDLRRMMDAARRQAVRKLERRKRRREVQHASLRPLPERYTICRLEKDETAPPLPDHGFSNLTRQGDARVLILPEDYAAGLSLRNAESGWACFALEGQLNRHSVGLLAALSEVLAAEDIPIVVTAAFDSAYLLVQVDKRDSAARALCRTGYSVQGYCGTDLA